MSAQQHFVNKFDRRDKLYATISFCKLSLTVLLLLELTSCRVGEKSLAEWLTIFEGATFPYGPVNTIPEVFSDPQVGVTVSV